MKSEHKVVIDNPGTKVSPPVFCSWRYSSDIGCRELWL